MRTTPTSDRKLRVRKSSSNGVKKAFSESYSAVKVRLCRERKKGLATPGYFTSSIHCRSQKGNHTVCQVVGHSTHEKKRIASTWYDLIRFFKENFLVVEKKISYLIRLFSESLIE